MAEDFSKRGILSATVYSSADGQYSLDRGTAIQKLKSGEIKVIFSVDMFNEGVDITSVDMVMFLRPTESPVVFLQQLGRGLRRSGGKEYLNVLDFIGNYEKAGKAPYLLSGKPYNEAMGSQTFLQEFEFPDECMVDFDLRLVDLFREMEKRNQTIRERIREEYLRVKELLEKVPGRMELFTYMDNNVYELCMGHSGENPFRRYLEYLEEMGDLPPEEYRVFNGIGREFLKTLETTNMQKSYKMPILEAFYNDGEVRLAVTDEEVLYSWKKFFSTGTNWRDWDDVASYEDYKKITDREHLNKAKKMPIHFLKKSGKEFFVEKEGYALALREEMKDVIQEDAFRKHMKDIIEYRTMEYYRRRYMEK